MFSVGRRCCDLGTDRGCVAHESDGSAVEADEADNSCCSSQASISSGGNEVMWQVVLGFEYETWSGKLSRAYNLRRPEMANELQHFCVQ